MVRLYCSCLFGLCYLFLSTIFHQDADASSSGSRRFFLRNLHHENNHTTITTTTTGNEWTSPIVVTLLAIVCALSILLGLCMLCAYYFYRKNDQIHRNREAILQFKVHRQEKTVRATEEDVKLLRGAWKIEHTELRLLDRLCVTNRAEVFSAILRGSWTLAVKVLKTRQGGPRTSSTAAAATLGSTSMHNSTGRTAMLGSDASSPHQHPRLSSSSSVSTGSSISSPAMDGDYYGRSGSEAAVQALRSEIEFLMRTRHERLVTFMGFGSTPSGRRFIVMELMETSLDVALWNKPTRNLLERVGILVDVASGLAFLHLRHRALHRDLKSPNVLLARSKAYGQWRAKLADFEASRIVIRGKRRVGTPRLSSLAAVPTATTTTNPLTWWPASESRVVPIERAST